MNMIPPNNIEAEQSTLGSMMIEPDAACFGMEVLEPEHFYRPVHVTIFNSIRRIYSTGKELDLISIQEDLRSRKQLEEVGGTEYLFSLVQSVPTAANIKTYVDIVVDKATRRQIIKQCAISTSLAYDLDSDSPSESFLQSAMSIKQPTQGDFKPLSAVVFDANRQFEDIQNGGFKRGIPYGLSDLDRLIYGAGPDAELTLVGGRPSNGKTVLLLTLAYNAIKHGKRVLFFSQETSATKLVMRMIRNIGSIDDTNLRDKNIGHDDEWRAIAEACNELYIYDDMLLINDVPTTINAAISKTRRAIAKYERTEHPVGLVLADYLQIFGTGNRENRNIEVQDIARGLRNITLQFKIPVVAATQLNRAEGTPSLKHLREGGNQEAEADKVILLDNPPTSDNQPTRPCKLIVAKHKDGPCGTIHCNFNGPYLRFEGIDNDHTE